MIIICERCGTKYRFDDQLVKGDGVWVRCSRCRHVFFQENPEAITEETGLGAEVSERIEEIKKAVEEEKTTFQKLESFESLGIEETEGLPPRKEAEEEKTPPSVSKKRWTALRITTRIFIIIFLAFLTASGIYLWYSPEGRSKVALTVVSYFPSLETWVRGWIEKRPFVLEIEIQDLRQHLVNNWLLGQMRVVEGTAINLSRYPLTKVQVRGRMYDAAGVIIGETISYCGNYLTDAELATLTEEEIKTKLSQTVAGVDDRLIPHGQVPFMLVFTHDSPAVSKVTVAPNGAERLLE